MVVPLRLNYALCLLKDSYRPLRPPLPSHQDRFREAIEHCNEVLAMLIFFFFSFLEKVVVFPVCEGGREGGREGGEREGRRDGGREGAGKRV